MSIHSTAYRRFVRQLRHTATDSVDHRTGELLASADNDTALALLYVMYAEDPPTMRAFQIAAEGLSLLNAEVAR